MHVADASGESAGGLAVGGAAIVGTVVAGPISGAALNPAVAFSLCLCGIVGWQWLPIYVLAQLLGAVLAALTDLGQRLG